jgi:hypothetical protein
MRGTGAIAELLRNRFKIACKRLNLNSGSREIPQHTRLFQPPIVESSQLSLGVLNAVHLQAMSTAIAKNLIAEMKLLGMFAASKRENLPARKKTRNNRQNGERRQPRGSAIEPSGFCGPCLKISARLPTMRTD